MKFGSRSDIFKVLCWKIRKIFTERALYLVFIVISCLRASKIFRYEMIISPRLKLFLLLLK